MTAQVCCQGVHSGTSIKVCNGVEYGVLYAGVVFGGGTDPKLIPLLSDITTLNVSIAPGGIVEHARAFAGLS
jgi:hypothetical protein